jgi:hypothetical protein
MKKWFFTFGTDSKFPYQNGWIEIHADSINEALAKFETRFGDKAFVRPGIYNYAFDYTEERFIQTGMFKGGNFGFRCHEVIA